MVSKEFAPLILFFVEHASARTLRQNKIYCSLLRILFYANNSLNRVGYCIDIIIALVFFHGDVMGYWCGYSSYELHNNSKVMTFEFGWQHLLWKLL